MTTTDYNPISFNGEALTQPKLNQLCNNVQYLFERQPRMRYAVSGTSRDTGLKIISGKTFYGAPSQSDYIWVPIMFGTFFSPGCKPVITASNETVHPGLRNKIVIMALSQTGEIDNTGFLGIVSSEVVSPIPAGWVHWIAVGY